MQLPEDTDEQRRALAAAMWKCPEDMAVWAEGLGYKALEARIANGAAIHAQATTTLTVVLAALAGLGGWALELLKPEPGAAAWGALAGAGYLTALAYLIVARCINLRDAPATYNRPGNLMVPDASLHQVRIGELANLDERIRQQAAFNERRASALNALRLAAVAVAPVFALGAAAARWWMP